MSPGIFVLIEPDQILAPLSKGCAGLRELLRTEFESMQEGGSKRRVDEPDRNSRLQFSEIVKVVSHRQLDPSGFGDRCGAAFTTELSRLVSEVARHRKALYYRQRKSGQKLPTVVFLEDLWPTAGPSWTAGPVTTAVTAQVTTKAA